MTRLYYLARTTTIPCWAIKTRPRLTQLALLADMSGQLGQLQHSHRISISSLPGRSRVSTVVVVPFEDNHLPRQGVHAKLKVGMEVSGGGGIGARGTVLLEQAVLHRRTDVLWTRLVSVLVHQRGAPRVMTLRREVVGDCQRLIVARTKKTVTLTVACVTTFFRSTSALLMQTSLRWLFLCWGVALSRGSEMVSSTSSSMPVLLAAGV